MSLGVGTLFGAIVGAFWLLGSSFLDSIAGFGSRSRHQTSNEITKIVLPCSASPRALDRCSFCSESDARSFALLIRAFADVQFEQKPRQHQFSNKKDQRDGD